KVSGKIGATLTNLLGSNDALIEEVKKTQKIKKPEDIKKLAALDQSDWKDLLSKSAEKIQVNGKRLDKKLIDFHAVSLASKMEREFPAAAFAAQLGREKESVFKNHDRIASFFKEHPEFDLQKSNIDIFLNEKKVNGDENDGLRSELKSAQRIFRLIPN